MSVHVRDASYYRLNESPICKKLAWLATVSTHVITLPLLEFQDSSLGWRISHCLVFDKHRYDNLAPHNCDFNSPKVGKCACAGCTNCVTLILERALSYAGITLYGTAEDVVTSDRALYRTTVSGRITGTGISPG